ncbi:MAG: DUF1428 domain-containing protein [Sphingomonas sp.]
MDYIQGFLIPVSTAKKDGYREMAADAAPLFTEYGATRIVETWGAEVMDGKRTDMKRAVDLKDDETVVFSWIRWPDRATCDAAAEKMMADDRMKMPDDMPFDGKRLIYGGFEAATEAGKGGAIGYVDGFVAAVADSKRDAFTEHSRMMADLFVESGALRVVDGWGIAVPEGTVTDFRRAVDAQADETVAFGWVEWPDKATRDAGMGKVMEAAAVQDNPPPWNGPTAIFGGFTPIFDTDH